MVEKSEKEAAERIVRIFDERVCYTNALTLFQKLADMKWHFARACILYEAAIMCGMCEKNLN